jgi:hypothetical protein
MLIKYCSPVGRRFAPAPPHAAFDTFLLCRNSSTFAINKFDGYHLKICSTPVSFGPASPDAGVELLRQLFLQCMVFTLLKKLGGKEFLELFILWSRGPLQM